MNDVTPELKNHDYNMTLNHDLYYKLRIK